MPTLPRGLLRDPTLKDARIAPRDAIRKRVQKGSEAALCLTFKIKVMQGVTAYSIQPTAWPALLIMWVFSIQFLSV